MTKKTGNVTSAQLWPADIESVSRITIAKPAAGTTHSTHSPGRTRPGWNSTLRTPIATDAHSISAARPTSAGLRRSNAASCGSDTTDFGGAYICTGRRVTLLHLQEGGRLHIRGQDHRARAALLGKLLQHE